MKNKVDQMDIFLHNIAWLRNHYGISKKRMAKILGVSVGTINKMESDILPPRLDVSIIFNIQDYFGIKLTELFAQQFGE